MAHAREELRFREVRLFCGALGQRQGLLDQAALRQVPGQFGEPARVARRVANRREDHVGPEHRSILANPPPFDLVSALGRGRVQVALRSAARDVRRRIEPGEVLAHDLVRGVALDPLRAGIPAHDATFGVQHHDGGVGHALHHQPKAFLGPPQLLFDLLAGGIVGADQQVSDDAAFRVAQRGDRHDRGKAAAVLPDVGQLVLVLDAARGLEGQRLEARRDRRRELPAQGLGALDHFLRIVNVGRRDLVDHFDGRVPQHRFGADVEELNDAFLIGGDDREVGAGENRALEQGLDARAWLATRGEEGGDHDVTPTGSCATSAASASRMSCARFFAIWPASGALAPALMRS